MQMPSCVNEIPIVNRDIWLKRREEAYRRFLEDVEIGYADKDIVDFIKCVFTKKKVYTSSSCSGRITIVDSAYPWLRDESYVIFKKHEPVTVEEVLNVIKHDPLYRFWLISSGPIIHFIAIDIDAANRILKTAREAGFKHSGVISFSESGIVVEVVSGTWTPFLLKDGAKPVANDIERVIALANEILIEGKKRLDKLFKAFKEIDI